MKQSVYLLAIVLVVSILNGCIISMTPDTNNIPMTAGEQMSFSVKAYPSNTTYKWTLDGTALSNTEKSYVYTAEGGDHILRVKSKDWVSTDSQTWNIHVNGRPIYVSPSGDDSNTGNLPSQALKTIQKAINAASGTQAIPISIKVAAGTYQENLTMESWESIEGGWNNDFSQRWNFETYGITPANEFKTILDGGKIGRCINIVNLQGISVDGFTIRNGLSLSGGGGAILNDSSSPTIANCLFSGNNISESGGGGGAICNLNSMNKITDISKCLFVNNKNYDYEGGAIYNSSSSCNIIDCSFSANSGRNGIIANRNSTVHISKSIFTGNEGSGSFGAAISGMDNSNVFLSDCEFTSNHQGDYSGGAFANTGSASVTNCIFSKNHTCCGGAAIYNTGSLSVESCTFSENNTNGWAGAVENSGKAYIINSKFDRNDGERTGGAIQNSGECTLVNCILSLNTADDGGAIYNTGSLLSIINCLIVDNTASMGSGGGLYNGSAIFSPRIVNSIFWGDTASVEGQEIYNSEGALLPDISYSDIEGCNPWDTGIGTDRGGNIDYDPYLDLSYHLMQLSKCIDAGDPDSSTARGFPAYDMDGQVRPNGEAYDIGTDEYYAR